MSWLIGLLIIALELTPIAASRMWAEQLEAKLTNPPASLLGLQRPSQLKITELPTKTGPENLSLGANGVYVFDLGSGQAIYEKDAGGERPIASITKLATMLVILRDHALTETVTVPNLPTYGPADVTLGLIPGQRFKVGDLVQAALIKSANDAADALAIYDSGTTEAFHAKMNSLVAEWGIASAHFASASGLNEAGNYASPRALAKLAAVILTNSTVRSLASNQTGTIYDAGGRRYDFSTTNQLLGSDARIKGLKTGYTALAGQSFVALAEIKGHMVITVVLNSPDRFGETRGLVDWIERNYTWQ